VILYSILHLFVGPVSWLLGQFPSASSVGLPDFSSYGAAIGDWRIWQYFGWANHFLPLDLAAALFGVRLLIWAALYGIEFLSWLGTKLHLFGGSQ
jgi:hypothetical protein